MSFETFFLLLLAAVAVSVILVIIIIENKPKELPYTAEVKFTGHQDRDMSFHSMHYEAIITDKETGEFFKANFSRYSHMFKYDEEEFVKEECQKAWDAHKVETGRDYSI